MLCNGGPHHDDETCPDGKAHVANGSKGKSRLGMELHFKQVFLEPPCCRSKFSG